MRRQAAVLPPAARNSEAQQRVRVWDWPTRIIHWLFVLLMPALWWSATNGWIEIHMQLGLAAFALILFRLIWGLIGSSTARFSNFIKGPRAVISYLNGRAAHALGHNPLGGWSVAVMLAVLALQIALGLFATDEDGLLMGPLSLWVDGDTAEWATNLHEWLFNLILGLIALHVAAILFYALARRRNLVTPMLTGRAAAAPGAEPMRGAPAWRLLAALLLTAGATFWLWTRL